MAQWKHGNMWSAWEQADLFVITTNGIVTKDGRLVMGKGIALEAKERFPGIDQVLGACVSKKPYAKGESASRTALSHEYHLLVSQAWPHKKLACLQTKYHWMGCANVKLIKESLARLKQWAEEHPAAQIHVNMPGVGEGKVKPETIMRYVEALPDNVYVWRY